MIMPFGMYAGEDVADLPCDYLLWIVENVDLYGDLEQAVLDAIEENECDNGY